MTKIRIVDALKEGLSSEDTAMLQALYSRSNASVDDHLQKVREMGSSKFMETYYLNYSHKSIADCGSTTVFIEGLSMPAAKAIQDSPLYNGQECSTRYIDYVSVRHVEVETVGFWHDICKDASATMYRLTYDAVVRHMRNHWKDEIDIENPVVKNAIHARACDFARGFLLLSSQTQVAWTTTLRQFGDRIAVLEQHPLAEVREIASTLRKELVTSYPSSFKTQAYESQAAFNSRFAEAINYLDKAEDDNRKWAEMEHESVHGKFGGASDLSLTKTQAEILRNRPAQVELPASVFSGMDRILAEFIIDYGSFRDLQRHRSANVRHEHPSGPLFINQFYMIPYILWMEMEERKEFSEAFQSMRNAIEKAGAYSPASGKPELQYLYPLGQNIRMTMDMAIPSAVYIAEIRCGKAVHPTARAAAQMLAKHLASISHELKIHVDWDFLHPEDGETFIKYDPDELFVARGLQTFRKNIKQA